MATPTNRVPLGQAGTGEAFVLDQRQAMAPFQTFAALSANQAATKRAAEKAKAEQDEKTTAYQKKMLENLPDEFAFEYQQDMVNRVKSVRDKAVAKMTTNGGKLSPSEELSLAQEIKDIELEKKAQDVTTKELADVTASARTDKELVYELYEQEARKILFDPATGKLRPAAQIKGEDIDTRLRNNYKLVNRAVTVDNFVKTQHGQQMDIFSKAGGFDVQTVLKHNLPVEVENGKIVYDRNGRPKFKPTRELLYDADGNPKMKLLLDGLMKEEDEKLAADPTYVRKDRLGLLGDLMKNEVYEEKDINRSRTPQASTGGAAKPSDLDKKREAADRRLALVDDAFINRNPDAFKSLVNSQWAGGIILDVTEAPVQGFQRPNGIGTAKDLYGNTNQAVMQITVDYGTKDVQRPKTRTKSNGEVIKTGEMEIIKERDIRTVTIDTSKPGWRTTVSAALNTENANIEPEIFNEQVRRKYGNGNPAPTRPAARTTSPAPRQQPARTTPPKGKYDKYVK